MSGHGVSILNGCSSLSGGLAAFPIIMIFLMLENRNMLRFVSHRSYYSLCFLEKSQHIVIFLWAEEKILYICAKIVIYCNFL